MAVLSSPVQVPSDVRTRHIKQAIRTKVTGDFDGHTEITSDRVAFLAEVQGR